MPRQFTPISKEDLYDRFKALCTGDSLWQWQGTTQVQKDIDKIDFDFENFSCVKDSGGGPRELMGPTTLNNGLTFIGCCAGGDWQHPVFFIVYYDGKKLRGYVPKKGNTWDPKTKAAKPAEAIVSFNKKTLQKDIEERITLYEDKEDLLSVGKKLVRGIISTTGYVESQSLCVLPATHQTGFTSSQAAVDSFVKAIQEVFAEETKEIPACKKCGRGGTRSHSLAECFYNLCQGSIDSTAEYWQALESKGWRVEGVIEPGKYAIVNNLDGRMTAIDEDRQAKKWEGEVLHTIVVC